jgi:hypothetical protein
LKELDIGAIRIDGGTQSRAHLDESVVSEYADAMTDGTVLPAVIVYFDGAEYWLADGFHRFFAHRKIGALKINADITNGSRRDAVLHSVGANGSHGLRRTNEDKRRSVDILLADAEWSSWSDREIAKKCCVSVSFVGAIRRPAVAEKQKENRDRSVTKKVNSSTAVSTPEKPPVVESAIAPTTQPTVEAPPSNDASYDEFGPSDSELAFHEEREIADRAAYDGLVEVALSDDKLGEALKLVATQAEEIARLKAELRVMRESRDSHMNGKNEAIRLVKSLQKKLAKYEKAAA